MTQNFVRFSCDLICENPGPLTAYRLYVNDELLSERHFRGTSNQAYREVADISAIPGQHLIHVRSLDPQSRVEIAGVTVLEGPAHTDAKKYLIIT